MDDRAIAADGAELSSLSSVIRDLMDRVSEVARRYEGSDREDVSFELYEVERGLRGAARRLDRLTRSLQIYLHPSISPGEEMFNLRFDLRTPPFTEVTHGDQYRAMLEMVKWADTRGFAGAITSEHHGTEDGFMSAPLAISAAILGSTDNMMCTLSALLVPYHDPLRLAEDIATIDLMAPGRFIVIAGLGYREFEFEMFGKDRTRRGRDTEEAIMVMQQAWTGEPFEYEGRTAWITPKPVTQPHPIVMVGGSVPASAKRAARLRLPYMPPIGDQELVDLYYAEAAEIGFEEAFAMAPDGPGLVLVTEDPDALWAKIGPNMLYDAAAYASWQYPDQRSGWHVDADDVAGLKASGQFEVLTPDECVELVRTKGAATLHPLCGGIDPAIGWETLELVVDKVMPALAEGS